jgi:hypothetical protein
VLEHPTCSSCSDETDPRIAESLLLLRSSVVSVDVLKSLFVVPALALTVLTGLPTFIDELLDNFGASASSHSIVDRVLIRMRRSRFVN